MNFSQFLTTHIDEDNIREYKGKDIKRDIKKDIKREVKDIKEDIKKDVKRDVKRDGRDSKENTAIIINSMFNVKGSLTSELTKPEFRRGQFVKIINMKNSLLNNYKGYNGEIRDYVRNGDHAYIILEGVNSPQAIKFPIKHFINRENMFF